MATFQSRSEVDHLAFPSAGVSEPPPPATPYLTKKLLTMVTSGDRNDVNNYGPNLHHLRSTPVSPTDSVAQAMKNDLEELVGYIDNLAFDPSMEKADTPRARTPSTNKQLFSSEGTPLDTIRDESTSERKSVFRDRTNNSNNKYSDHARATITPGKTRVLDPMGKNHRSNCEEPAGSPPPQESSMYFHDESLSLILSRSEDTDTSSTGGGHFDSKDTNLYQEQLPVGSERSTRLLSTFQKGGVIPTPARAKSISFRSVSKDPTPSKPPQSASTFNYNAATPLRPDNALDQNKVRFDPVHDLRSRIATPFPRCRDQLEEENDLKNRAGTPFPRNHRVDQQNMSRKGNEWWRVRPVTVEESPTRRSLSFLPDSKDVEEDTEERGLRWESSVPTPLPKKQNVKGTPHPFGRKSDCRSTDDGEDHIDDSILHRSVPETPMTTHGSQPNLVLTSPESAKKLLKDAISALQEAREERDSAREWANSIKESVHNWVEQQRELIRTESALTANTNNALSTEFLQQQHQAIEDLINNLRNEIKVSQSGTENQLERMLVKQDVQIRELSRQLSEVKSELSRVVKANKTSDPTTRRTNSQNTSRHSNMDAPGSSHKTPLTNAVGVTRTASRSERSSASSRGSHRTRRSTPGGGHLIDYGNGVTKEVHPDGTTVTRFRNGDVETRFAKSSSRSSSPSASAVMAYYHSQEEVLKITLKDGSVLYEYATGQVERHCANGIKIIRFPDGTKTIV